MAELDTAMSARLCVAIEAHLPEASDFVLVIVEADGSISTVSSVGPSLAHQIVKTLAEGWEPVEVDNIAVHLG